MAKKTTPKPAITLPADQYAHPGAPTEWWWHIGTLRSVNDPSRIFGFEINASADVTDPTQPYSFTQLEIIDIKNKLSYQKVNFAPMVPPNWAESDPSKPWHVQLPGYGTDPTDGAVSMFAGSSDPLNMLVQATFSGGAKTTKCALSLNLRQEGPPMLVWGTGCREIHHDAPTPLLRNNYYYSLTNLKATGTITIGAEQIEVEGTTWMDHEYGCFSSKTTWLLQDIQLENGLQLSNFVVITPKNVPQLDVPMASTATMLLPSGESIYVDTLLTPMGPLFPFKGVNYFMKFKIQLKDSPVSFVVNSLFDNQVFIDNTGSNNIYEGIGSAEMYIKLKYGQEMQISKGTAWIEQDLPSGGKK